MSTNVKTDRTVTATDGTRLAFVNPNAACGTINGVPLTPPYEDMCISVNLEIEVVARTKTDNVGFSDDGGFNSNVYVMSWVSNFKTDSNGNYTGQPKDLERVYFMQGRDAQEYLDGISKEKFLTTYYTDISLEDIRNRNIVEGLGITNVEIAYDNMYMPTITIKFVDVRGSSLFGREEEVHDGNNITSETIFGCFFTLPYPKFKLHVKGFYGDAVTYQLACTGFKGNFNSQSGNFEITTTFIGYQYSLLTDIPFVQLIAAPYCEYIGEKYWDKHVKTPEWQLSDGASMKKLYDMYTELKKELKNGIGGEAPAASVDLSSKDIALKQLWSIWEDIKSSLQSRCTYFGYTKSGEAYKNPTTNELFFLCMHKEEATIYDDKIAHKLANMKEEVDKYNEAYKDNPISFKIADNFSKSKTTKAVKLVNYKADTGGSVTCTQTNATYIDGLKKFVASKIKEESKNKYKFFENKSYGYVFSDGGFENSAKNVTENISTEKKEEEAKVKEKEKDFVPEEISKALGFKPSIGNFFKVIIAHLETFTAMMYGCATTILKQMKNGGREPSRLGVNFDNTDVLASQKFIPPFPAVFKQDVNKNDVEGAEEGGVFKALGWVGDFSANFEEEKLIVGIYNAAQRIVQKEDKLSTKPSVDVSKLFPSMPFDLYTNNIMTSISGFTTDMMAALLGVRMTQIFGVLNNGELTDTSIAEAHGRMDALNLFQAVSKKADLRDALFTEKKNESGKKDEKTSNFVSKESIIYDIMRCIKNKEAETYAQLDKNNNVSNYEFEHHSYGAIDTKNGTKYVYADNPRYVHPVIINSKDDTMLTEGEDKTIYTYIWGGENGNEFGIVPVRMQTPSSMFGSYVFAKATNNGVKSDIHGINLHSVGTEEVVDKTFQSNDNILHTVSSPTLFENDVKYKDYINESMFNIITDKSVVKSVCDRCEALKKDDIKIDGYDGKISNFKNIIDRYFDLDVKKYLNTNKKEYLAKGKKDTLSADKIEKDKINTSEKQFEISIGEDRSSINKKLTFMDIEKAFTTDDLNEYYVPYCLCQCVDQDGGNKQTLSLDITTAFLNEYADIEDRNLILALKCWWLIQTVPLDWSKTKDILKPIGTHGSIKKVPLAMVLLLGGAIYLSKKVVDSAIKEKILSKNDTKLTKTTTCDIHRRMYFTFSDEIIDKTNNLATKAEKNNWRKNKGEVGPTSYNGIYSFCNEGSKSNDVIFKTCLVNNGDKNYYLRLVNMNDNAGGTILNNSKTLSFKDIFDGADNDNWRPDSFIANKLEDIFVNWVTESGANIIKGMCPTSPISWGALGAMQFELGKIYNQKQLIGYDAQDQHVLNSWGGKTLLPYGTSYSVLNYKPSKYCNYFSSVWDTPLKNWCKTWEKTWWPKDETGKLKNRKNVLDKNQPNSVVLYSGRSATSTWCEGDEHWLAVTKNNEYIAYWQSDAPFREDLLNLYTGSCLICINSPNFKTNNYNPITDVF